LGVHHLGVHHLGMHLLGVHLLGVYFIGVHLTQVGMYLMGVGVHLIGVVCILGGVFWGVFNSRNYQWPKLQSLAKPASPPARCENFPAPLLAVALPN
jgi:hypothetical protein